MSLFLSRFACSLLHGHRAAASGGIQFVQFVIISLLCFEHSSDCPHFHRNKIWNLWEATHLWSSRTMSVLKFQTSKPFVADQMNYSSRFVHLNFQLFFSSQQLDAICASLLELWRWIIQESPQECDKKSSESFFRLSATERASTWHNFSRWNFARMILKLRSVHSPPISAENPVAPLAIIHTLSS